MRLLVVEDAVPVRERLVSAIAQVRGVEDIIEAGQVSEATEYFRSLHPDVVTLDIRLPGGSGIEVLETIKSESPGTVVIMFTNLSLPHYREHCERAGANYFFAKAANFKESMALLSSLARVPAKKATHMSEEPPRSRRVNCSHGLTNRRVKNAAANRALTLRTSRRYAMQVLASSRRTFSDCSRNSSNWIAEPLGTSKARGSAWPSPREFSNCKTVPSKWRANLARGALSPRCFRAPDMGQGRTQGNGLQNHTRS